MVFEFNWFKSYDAVRNFLTRKPQNEIHKLKLNFENATLADGWDVNKESDNFCIILQDGKNHQFLAVLKDSDKHIFAQTENNPMYQDSNSGWTKMNYKLLP
ncbi:MAG: hypothetical protein LBG52_06585 [Candidatus Peribacteria bacterium]|nr:hypothetical protein [Candidatus Peribacteria bacterium]